MPILKLDAIDSTNDFLKSLAATSELENYTAVTAKSQTRGRGQMGSAWVSEPGKNLTMSVLVNNFICSIEQQFTLNIAVSVAVIKALQPLQIPNLAIKWPNDIMSANRKIGGILIENTIKSDRTIYSVVGIGLNVNQTDFHALPKASSLAVIMNRTYEITTLAQAIVSQIKLTTESFTEDHINITNQYKVSLFKKGVPMPFKGADDINFMGIIRGIDEAGRVIIERDDDSRHAFSLKEITMLY